MIYFDNNATTPIAAEVVQAMMPFLTYLYGNPSSAHEAGRECRLAVERAREQVAEMLGATSAAEIVFTSCGTESDNWAIYGAMHSRPENNHIITTRVEHEAVRKPIAQLEQSGCKVTWLDVDESGALDLEQLRASITEGTSLVSIMMANNETGVLFPVAEIANLVKDCSDAYLHVDGVNAAGKVPIDLKNTAIDLFSISAHKFHGPKGIGALYIRDGGQLEPYLLGGGQESSRRAGTEAVHQIVGLGSAAQLAADLRPMENVRRCRNRLESMILESSSCAIVNGATDSAHRLPNTTNISFEGLNGEVIMNKLSESGICVSTGSACHSADHSASAVLEAMNVPFSRAMGSIRFSLGRHNTEAEVETVVREVVRAVGDLGSLSAVS
jgi:cysteine desulfurase